MSQGSVFDAAALQPWLMAGLGLFAALGALSLMSSFGRAAALLLRGRQQPRPRLSLLFVVHDGAHKLEGLLRPLLSPLSSAEGLPFDWECIVVDDNSTDDTHAILRRLSRDFRLLQVVRTADDFSAGADLLSAAAALPSGAAGTFSAGADPLCRGLRMCRGAAVLSFDLRSSERWNDAMAVVLSLEKYL